MNEFTQRRKTLADVLERLAENGHFQVVIAAVRLDTEADTETFDARGLPKIERTC
jgi:hypothetical protein